MMKQLDQTEVQRLPDKLLGQIIHNLQAFPNETVDFRQPHLRQSLAEVFPLFLVLYGLLVILGTSGNVAMILHILRGRVYKDPTYAYVMNIGVCNVVMSVVLLPVSLAILLIQNWIFGSFLCYFVPMLQDIPMHATMATMVFIAVDRYRIIFTPTKPRLPPFASVVAVWILSVCVVLPYAVYMNYIDLQTLFGPQFEGVGICTVNLTDEITEYIRGLFVVLYAFPLALIAFLHVRVSSEMKSREAPVNMVSLDGRPRRSQPDVWSVQDDRQASSLPRSPRNQHPSFSCRSGWRPNEALDGQGRPDGGAGGAFLFHHDAQHRSPYYTPTPTPKTTPTRLGGRAREAAEGDLDVAREKRNQRYLTTMVIAFGLCLCPLMTLRMVKNMVLETYDNSGLFDITFISFVWMAFLPTVTTPAVFALWRMSRLQQVAKFYKLFLERNCSINNEATSLPVIKGLASSALSHCTKKSQSTKNVTISSLFRAKHVQWYKHSIATVQLYAVILAQRTFETIFLITVPFCLIYCISPKGAHISIRMTFDLSAVGGKDSTCNVQVFGMQINVTKSVLHLSWLAQLQIFLRSDADQLYATKAVLHPSRLAQLQRPASDIEVHDGGPPQVREFTCAVLSPRELLENL
ncbi:5-hydroxytryptamine receptor 1D-like [Penaeus monodon]|uniref:5-hydroxytryptamine receptor 1D-like n=1 Tax=Penaeus monodon TaxID=6687 RepID=UPI0018A6D925|nr:5-hydroxytryptamine receptor 1D-like [Penaeus monodon]